MHVWRRRYVGRGVITSPTRRRSARGSAGRNTCRRGEHWRGSRVEKTIEQIDVLWLKGRSIRRAFEVEHTTSIYSGILRMADLLALQPNMDIRLHIVAPPARRDKVFQELRRPVFSLLDRGPLSESCSYLSYESVRELAQQQHLSHLSDTVLDEYDEEPED